MKTHPPRAALKFLRWFCREDYVEEIEGDLTEIFEKHHKRSPAKAKIKFAWSVVRYLRPEFIRLFKRTSTVNPSAMFRHNLLIALRNILRYKTSFVINLTGLATGLTCVLLIYLWVYDEWSFDRFHEKSDRLYQVMRNTSGPANTVETHESNSNLLPPALASSLPEVEHVVPLRPMPQGIVSFGQTAVKATGSFAGRDFFNAFSYKVLHGDKDRLLHDKYAMVISDALAVKLFGNAENSIGKTVVWDMRHFGDTHVVSGVFEKGSYNSSEPFDFLVTYEAFLGKNTMDVNWDSNPILTYLTLKPGVNAEAFNDKLNSFYRSQYKKSDDATRMFLRPYADRYLYGYYENGKQAGGRIDYVILFSMIALFILIIACINFMNLSTARASRRIKEIGVKKAIGVSRRLLVQQHLGESMLMAVCSLAVSLLLVNLLLPQFNLITGKQLGLDRGGDLIMGIMIIVLVTGLISGSYPAFYLSGFKPTEVLKGRLRTSAGELWVRKGLTIFQFSISVLLIVAVVIVYRQMDFVQTRNLGYDKDNVIIFGKQGLQSGFDSFLSEAANTAGVLNVSSMADHVTNVSNTSWGHRWEGQVPGTEATEFHGMTVGFDFIETLNLKVKEGRSFSRDFGTEEATVILNEAAVKAMGMADPVGKWMQIFKTKREIIGVVKDFHFQSMHAPIKPIFILCYPDYARTVLVKIQAGTEKATIARLNKLYQRHNPGIPFEVKFLDDEYQALYTSEQRVSRLSKYFAAVAIVISCLGLFGLAAFSAERRTKEIGIRKILGCSELRIIHMLAGDFTAMVLVAIAVALPVSYLLATYWLQNFAYRIDLDWWLFAASGVSALLTAWITVGIQTVRAARVSPVTCLRSE